jgi:DNA (cytosine-5)-methyltransferase 1
MGRKKRLSENRRVASKTARCRILDLFCGAGSASIGYERAGFEPVGIDILPQPSYSRKYEFIQCDAMDFVESVYAIRHMFQAIHASPPCQSYSAATMHLAYERPRLIEPLRPMLDKIDIPYVIENVNGAPMLPGRTIMLCGTMFQKKIRRHRLFESNVPLVTCPWPCDHEAMGDVFQDRHGKGFIEEMELTGTQIGIVEARQSIPPYFTEYIGLQLKEHIATVREGVKQVA